MKSPRELLARCALVQRPMPRKDTDHDKLNFLNASRVPSSVSRFGHALYSEFMRRHDRVRARTFE